jgi:hypothetical protein
MVSKLVAGAMAIFGLLTFLAAMDLARFVVMAQPAAGVVVGHGLGTGYTQREVVEQPVGQPIRRRTIFSSYVGEVALVEFAVNGEKVVTEARVDGVKSRYQVGARFDVLYDPWSPRYAFIVDEAPGWGGVLGSAMTGLVALGLALLTMIVFGGWARHFPNFRLR